MSDNVVNNWPTPTRHLANASAIIISRPHFRDDPWRHLVPLFSIPGAVSRVGRSTQQVRRQYGWMVVRSLTEINMSQW
ncbi:unnamed protein product, partial [Nesidiocoris tenuis]